MDHRINAGLSAISGTICFWVALTDDSIPWVVIASIAAGLNVLFLSYSLLNIVCPNNEDDN